MEPLDRIPLVWVLVLGRAVLAVSIVWGLAFITWGGH